jgi:hypothetical protein
MALTRDAVLHLMIGRTTPICPSCVSAALDVERRLSRHSELEPHDAGTFPQVGER